MPFLELSADFKPYYEIHDATDPWTHPETVLFVHGFTESTEAFRAWVPYLSRKYRVVTYDLRGFGKTAPVDSDFKYSTDLYVDDIVRIINRLAGEPVHIVGFKSGCITTMRLAATRPDLVRSITLACPPMVAPGGADWQPFMEEHGMRAWARKTMPARLGKDASPRAIDWWTDLMGATSITTARAYLRWVGTTEAGKDMPAIKCPTLVIMTKLSSQTNAAAGQVPPEVVQKGMPHAEILLLDLDCYHPAASHPDICAPAMLAFLQKLA
jgi:pimeloyl-ACP methyl ester carboxylesterase